MGFPFAQHELMQPMAARTLTKPYEFFFPDLMLVTSVPPLPMSPKQFIEEHEGFVSHVEKLCPSTTTFIYGLQSPPDTQDQLPLYIHRGLVHKRISVMSLAYEMGNLYGGGFAVPDMPLTGIGKNLLNYMAGEGMILDLAHVGHRTCRDALDYIERLDLQLPVMASHVGCHAVYPHLRNLPDDILKEIARRDGVIGLVTMNWLLGPEEEDDSAAPFLRHFEHLLKTVGRHAVAFGTDGVYRHVDLDEGKAQFERMREALDRRGNFKPRFPDEAGELRGPSRIPRALGKIWKERFQDLNLQEAVAGKNAARFFLKHLRR